MLREADPPGQAGGDEATEQATLRANLFKARSSVRRQIFALSPALAERFARGEVTEEEYRARLEASGLVCSGASPDDRLVADSTAWLKTPEAPGGSVLVRPLTRWWTVLAPTFTRLATPSSDTICSAGANPACE